MLVLDAGALVAVERGNRDVIALIKRERRAGRAPITHGGIIGQVWRGGGRQANLARLLPGLNIAALSAELGRRSGALLARSQTTDVIDAALVLLAQDGDEILTADPDDLRALVEASGVHADVLDV
jgi:hypothetical protein